MAQVPSALFLTDCLLELDRKCKFMLLSCLGKESRVEAAGREAKALKKLCSALRYLLRNSRRGMDEKMTELKGLLAPSPRTVPRASYTRPEARPNELCKQALRPQ